MSWFASSGTDLGLTEEEWVERYGVDPETRETDRRLQAAIDALPDSVPPPARRACESCGKPYEFEMRDGLPDANFDMDGSASVGLICWGCGMQSAAYWTWDEGEVA